MRKATGGHDSLGYLIEVCDAPGLLRLNVCDSRDCPIQLFPERDSLPDEHK
jgi:hypothetical protein